jgi:DNA-binding XRE family transcriptional regulator
MNVEISQKFANQLRILLHRDGISQTILAGNIGMSKQVMTKWLNGQSVPDMVSFKRIANFFGVPYEFLYGDEKNEHLWDLKTTFGATMTEKMTEKKLDAYDVAEKMSVEKAVVDFLLNYKLCGDTYNRHSKPFNMQSLSKLCGLLRMNVDDYIVYNPYNQATVSPYRSDEEAIIKAYRENPDMQTAVRKLLDVEIEEGE